MSGQPAAATTAAASARECSVREAVSGSGWQPAALRREGYGRHAECTALAMVPAALVGEVWGASCVSSEGVGTQAEARRDLLRCRLPWWTEYGAPNQPQHSALETTPCCCCWCCCCHHVTCSLVSLHTKVGTPRHTACCYYKYMKLLPHMPLPLQAALGCQGMFLLPPLLPLALQLLKQYPINPPPRSHLLEQAALGCQGALLVRLSFTPGCRR